MASMPGLYGLFAEAGGKSIRLGTIHTLTCVPALATFKKMGRKSS